MAAGGVCGLLGVAAGAFGAHALAERLSPEHLEVYRTAVLYQLIHSVALISIGAAACAPSHADERATRRLGVSSWAFVLGIALFSGSLYVLTLAGFRAAGVVTPFGGACFLLGWAFLVRTALGFVTGPTSTESPENVE